EILAQGVHFGAHRVLAGHLSGAVGGGIVDDYHGCQRPLLSSQRIQATGEQLGPVVGDDDGDGSAHAATPTDSGTAVPGGADIGVPPHSGVTAASLATLFHAGRL